MKGMEKFCDLKKIYMEFIIKIVNYRKKTPEQKKMLMFSINFKE